MIAPILFGSTPKRRIEVIAEAPQSIRKLRSPRLTKKQVFRRPPEPKASPQLRNLICTGNASVTWLVGSLSLSAFIPVARNVASWRDYDLQHGHPRCLLLAETKFASMAENAEGFRVPLGVRKSLMQEPAGRRRVPMGICASGCASACRELPRRMRWACRGSGFRARSQSRSVDSDGIGVRDDRRHGNVHITSR